MFSTVPWLVAAMIATIALLFALNIRDQSQRESVKWRSRRQRQEGKRSGWAFDGGPRT
jgi:hypothetical protein